MWFYVAVALALSVVALFLEFTLKDRVAKRRMRACAGILIGVVFCMLAGQDNDTFALVLGIFLIVSSSQDLKIGRLQDRIRQLEEQTRALPR
jgi:hypothetical protein